ncbi:alcohol dehydrogenase [Aerococcus urinaehominis]|uniref:Alcohol dehydrogenase n=1 Tax=Aerococcus urinaehominis TaxID=128944 RepID=A0A0X8FL10_9LACT|nr:iron-containing alcohol dehydrogenase family protein [Aerococcus urinaehominis]AMB99273.1 alcohol dehydrogenase [Aerococcus urinaehominis]SDM47398.1 uncharacterized oxidoreductase [Aerococcus urinaehominis]
MLNDLKVKVGPQVYQYHEGALDDMVGILQAHRAQRILLVHGQVSWQKAQPYLAKLYRSKLTIYEEKHRGECSYVEANRLAQIIQSHHIDFVIGVGGGKICDVTLQAAAISNIPYGVVPTLASNCAPWTPISVMYKEDGSAEEISEHEDRQAVFMLADPRLIIDAPQRLFIAGVADTMAKWYESDAILSQEKFQLEAFPILARQTTIMCRDIMFDQAQQAIADMAAGQVTPAFKQVSEMIMAVAGLVGGFANKYARVTLAHAAHDALTAALPAIHQYNHGEIVAYGIFFQLAAEEKWSEIDRLQDFFRPLNLPCALADMGIVLDQDLARDLAQRMNRRSQVHTLPYQVDEDFLQTNFERLENYMAQKTAM